MFGQANRILADDDFFLVDQIVLSNTNGGDFQLYSALNRILVNFVSTEKIRVKVVRDVETTK